MYFRRRSTLRIGKTLMIQHYVTEVATAALCRMVSVSDAFTPIVPDSRSR